MQNGCDHRCTFCIIPALRGDLVSRPIADVLTETAGRMERAVEAAKADLATAEQQFKEVLENNGQVMEAYDWLAKTHTAQAEYAAAQAILQNAVRLSPTISCTRPARCSSESAAAMRWA